MPRTRKSALEKAMDEAIIDTNETMVDESVMDGEVVPVPTDEGWNDYVLSKFLPNELDDKGNPTVDGLRRIAELLLGPIVNAVPHTVQAPNRDNGYHAVSEFTISIAWDGDPSDVRTFGDAADVYAGNTDPAFARFATQVATTRAEGRALRKALKLRKVVTAEELTSVPVSDSGLTGLIANYQIKLIDRLCRDVNIDVNKVINKGEFKFANITHMPDDQAQKLIDKLNWYLQNKDKIPTNIQGYDSAWRSQGEE